jgi:prevent-host-death family protein
MQMTVSSREFNHDIGRIKKASNEGPVFITDRGKPSHVLLSIEDYKKLTSSNQKISEMLSMPADDYLDFEIPKVNTLARAAEFD